MIPKGVGAPPPPGMDPRKGKLMCIKVRMLDDTVGVFHLGVSFPFITILFFSLFLFCSFFAKVFDSAVFVCCVPTVVTTVVDRCRCSGQIEQKTVQYALPSEKKKVIVSMCK